MGVAAQLQRFMERRKCSAPVTLTDSSRANAMPGALVPASRSSQLLPSTKPIDSARRNNPGEPQIQSSCPPASETAMIESQSRAAWPRTSSSRGNTVSYTHLRAHETRHDLVCRLLLEKKKKK